MGVGVRRAMVLAAGLGKRMRPLTDRIPKPLVEVAGRTLLDRALDHFQAFGIGTAVVNLHHKGDQVVEHLKSRRRPEIVFSQEDVLLETGGGVAKALGALGESPFFVANSDALWLDGSTPALARLAAAWAEDDMDVLLLLHAAAGAIGYDGPGDYFLDPAGRLRRRGGDEAAPFVFTGVQLLHPRLFADGPRGKFSLSVLYDRAQAAGRLFGLRHDGFWSHVGTPEALGQVEAALAERER